MRQENWFYAPAGLSNHMRLDRSHKEGEISLHVYDPGNTKRCMKVMLTPDAILRMREALRELSKV